MNPTPPDDASRTPLKDLIDRGTAPARGRRWMAIGGALAAVVVAVLLLRGGSTDGPAYRTEPVTVGDLVVRVSATGNLQPTNEVEVGSELSGIVEEVYVDDNDHVRRGQLLARLDTSKLADAIEK